MLNFSCSLLLQDVFSLGCVLAELCLDGRALFDLGSLLAYKKGEWDPATQVRTDLISLLHTFDVCLTLASLDSLLAYKKGVWDSATQVCTVFPRLSCIAYLSSTTYLTVVSHFALIFLLETHFPSI